MTDGHWYVIPKTLPYRKVKLHPSDESAFSSGFLLSDPKGLDTYFMLCYYVERGRYFRSKGYKVYARIISEEEYNIRLGSSCSKDRTNRTCTNPSCSYTL